MSALSVPAPLAWRLVLGSWSQESCVLPGVLLVPRFLAAPLLAHSLLPLLLSESGSAVHGPQACLHLHPRQLFCAAAPPELGLPGSLCCWPLVPTVSMRPWTGLRHARKEWLAVPAAFSSQD